MLMAWRRGAAPLGMLALLCLTGTPLRAQSRVAHDDTAERETGGGARVRDSADVLDRARDAQRDFERRRRWRLPHGSDAGGRCDVRVGRFCYWYDEHAPDGPPEPPTIGAERAALLELLDDAARAVPGDRWLAGQRVRYYLEADDTDGALAAARACDGDAAWCAALVGLALHQGDRPAAADSAFDAALAAMPDSLRCAWRDLSVLLDGAQADAYHELACADRVAMEERYWWLATPFFSRGGNDRRSEHYARLTLARLHAEGATTYATRWGDDLQELLVRYGAAERWSRVDPPIGSTAAPTVIGHDPSPSYRFTPGARVLDAPYDAAADDWPLRDPRAPERYSPPFARHLVALPAAVAALRRGDTLLVVASVRAPDDTLATARDTLALALAREDDSVRVVRAPLDDMVTVLHVRAPAHPQLASLEMLGDSGHAARFREGVHPPPLHDGFGLSELILYDPAVFAASSPAPLTSAGAAGDGVALDPLLDAVLHAPAAFDGVAAPGHVGLYWELYGLTAARAPVHFTLLVTGDSPNVFGRFWRRLRGYPADAAVRLQWSDVLPGDSGVAPRTIEVALPRLAPGTYRLELRAQETRGGRTASMMRTLVVRR